MIKQKILETAHDTFYRNGFHACGVELLARQAGTTKRTLYAHFGNKDGLIAAVLNYRHQRFMQWVTDALDDATPQNTAEKYIDFLRSWVQSEHFYGCMFINACGEFSDKATTPHQIAQAHKQTVRDYLRQCLQDNTVADCLFLYGEGLIVASQTGVSDVSNNAEGFGKLLVAG